MPKATLVLTVDVPPDFFFDVVTDYRRYPEFVPDLRYVRVVSESTDTSQIDFEVHVIRTLRYTLSLEYERPSRVRWSLVSGDLMKRNEGSWEIEEAGPGRTRATYTLELKLGAMVPAAVTTRLAQAGLPAMLDQFKVRAEGLWKEQSTS